MKTIKEQIQARIHCHATSKIAHLVPSSRFTDAIAAIQGV